MEYIPPLIMRVKEYSVYGQVKIKDHREYSSIEVLCYENKLGRMFVHVILTLHDGSSVRYINDHSILENIKLEGPARQAYYAAIEYTQEERQHSWMIKVRFHSHKNEEIVATIAAGQPSYDNKMLMYKPSGYVRHRELPVGFSFASRRLSSRSYVTINNRQYDLVPRQQLLGLGFGQLGRISEHYTRLNIMAPPERLEIKAKPAELKVGESWKYAAGKRELEYTIEDVEEGLLTLRRGKELHRVMLKDGKMQLSSMSSYDDSQELISIHFVPPLPICPHTCKQPRRMTVVSNETIIYEATVYINFDGEANRYNFVGDKSYPAVDSNIHYDMSISNGWVLTNIITE